MARKDSVEEWSCPLCTLLNAAKENRCAACDNARPLAHHIRKLQSLEPPLATATVPDVQHVSRPIRGLFYSSLPRDRCTSGAVAAWRQEKRLVVNRQRGNGRLNVIMDREREGVVTGTREQNADSTVIERGVKQELKTTDVVHSASDAVESMAASEDEIERQEEEEATMEEPCFNLLGSVAAVFNAPVADDTVGAIDEKACQDDSTEVDVDNNVVKVSSPSRYPGFTMASKMHVKERAIEEKLASAGLDLSDSEEEEKEPVLQLRQQIEKETQWVCQICSTLNKQTALECSSCSCKRYIDTSREVDMGTGSHLSTKNLGTAASENYSDKTWACSLCTTLNDPGITRCEVCDRLREEGPKNIARKGRECLVCTNINSPRSTRCEICETCLPTDEPPENHFVDLSFSSPARKASYTACQNDLEYPYVELSQYNDCNASNEAADPDVIEEISDHEPSMSLVNQRPLKVRPELMTFEHFVCIEDLRGDDGCRINYNKMFAGQRSSKSYADRLATRQAQSRKRKQDAARKEAGKTPTHTPRGGKAARGSNKRKTAAVQRRASAGGEKVPRTKRARKAEASARPASSTTKFPPAINHYDDSAADLGEDLSTMAWEGVGSAGYI